MQYIPHQYGKEYIERINTSFILALSLFHPALVNKSVGQYVNFIFPNRITKKDMHDSVIKQNTHLKEKIMKEFKITPQTFDLPKNTDQYLKYKQLNTDKWMIQKPIDGQKGDGIQITQTPNLEQESIVQEYIETLTYKKHKFDVRIYVTLTSLDPLIAYVYKGAVARLAYEHYESPSQTNKDDLRKHLTNDAVNNPNRIKNLQTIEGDETVLNLDYLFDQMKTNPEHFNFHKSLKLLNPREYFMKKIKENVEKTLVSLYPDLLTSAINAGMNLHEYPKSNYQILGLDICFTPTGEVKLFEINTNPVLFRKSNLNTTLSGPQVLIDSLNLIGIRVNVDAHNQIINPHFGVNDVRIYRFKNQYQISDSIPNRNFNNLTEFEQRAVLEIRDQKRRSENFVELEFDEYEFRESSYLNKLIWNFKDY
ncbi:Tubulin_tyrosine ligase [Hexamita inflata]|uniref:Tubulin_tyrosine ligase n=1 Tax=Hexamita inflata TaxID=28002 RepID=A0ABP1GID0_9EUKA